MFEREFYPSEENLGKNCLYWDVGGLVMRCRFPKMELTGRRSCEGVIDDVCLFIKDGRPAASLSQEEMLKIKTTVPSGGQTLPPGGIV